MSLNGNLEVFPLEEVLRLLARSRKSGCLRVEDGGVQGRIFLDGGAMTLATVVGDEELRRRLVAAGLVAEGDVRRIELSGIAVSETLAEGVTPAALTDFVREESVEGLYRIRRSGRGSFDFLVEFTPRYPTGQSFDTEVIVSEADRRALEWEDIESVVPSMHTVLRMVPELGDEETVTINPTTWRILAALGAGASVVDVAHSLGLSEFRAAREVASLFRNGLVTAEPVRAAEPPVEAHPDVVVFEQPVIEDAEATDVGEDEPIRHIRIEVPAPTEWQQAEPGEAAQATGDAAVDEITAEDDLVVEGGEPVHEELPDTTPDTGGSWWTSTPDVASPDAVAEEGGGDVEEPQAGADSDETDIAETDDSAGSWSDSPWKAEIPTEMPGVQASPWGGWVSNDSAETSESPSPAEAEELPEAETASDPGAQPVDRTGGWWAEAMGQSAAGGSQPTDSDADRFLESVFSSLTEQKDEAEKTPAEEDETGFGLGLLRRRRMGAAARDISDNNR